MKRQSLFIGAALAFAVFTLGAFDNYNQAFQAARKAASAKKYDEAFKAYEEAAKLAQTPAQQYQAAFNWAEAFRAKKSWAEAEKKMAEILANDKMTPTQKAAAQTYIGHYKSWQGKRAEAIAEYKKAVAIGSKSNYELDAANSCAGILVNMKKYDEALEYYQKTLAAEKPSQATRAVATLGIGRIYQFQKKYDEARKQFETISKDEALHPNYRAEANACLGRLFFAQNKVNEALAAYRNILNISKASPFYYAIVFREPANNLGGRLQKYDEALKQLDEAEASTVLPQTQKSWIKDLRCNIYISKARKEMREKKDAEAEKTLAALLAVPDPSSRVRPSIAALQIDLELNRGRQLRKEKKLAEAEASFRKAAEIKGAYAGATMTALHELARFLIAQKKYDEAKKYLDAAMALPKLQVNQQAANNGALADFYTAQKKYDDAIKTLEGILALSGNLNPSWKASAYSRIASIYFYQKKDIVKANEAIKKSHAVPGATWGKNPSLEKAIQKALDAQKQ